jgi:transcriptional regulator with XRE-family HTH domain
MTHSIQLRVWLRDNGMTQEALAEKLGYRRESVTAALRNEHMSDEFIGRFAQTFGFDVAERVFGEPAEDKAA